MCEKVGFKSFLNISPTVTHGAPTSVATSPTGTAPQSSSAGQSFTLTLDENPLAEFVELPEEALEGGLWFSNVLCGVIRGALEMVCGLCVLLARTCHSSTCRSKCRYKLHSSRTYLEAMRAQKSGSH